VVEIHLVLPIASATDFRRHDGRFYSKVLQRCQQEKTVGGILAPETPYVRKTDLSGVIGSIKHFLGARRRNFPQLHSPSDGNPGGPWR